MQVVLGTNFCRKMDFDFSGFSVNFLVFVRNYDDDDERLKEVERNDAEVRFLQV